MWYLYSFSLMIVRYRLKPPYNANKSILRLIVYLRIVGGIHTIDNIYSMSIGCVHWYILRLLLV